MVRFSVTCPQTLLNAEDNCFMMQGLMSIMSHADDNVSTAIDFIREGIKNAMDSDTLLNNEELPHVNRVSYLGTSLTDVLTSPTASGGSRSVTPTQSDGKNDNYAPIVAASFFGAGCVVLGLFLLVRQRRRKTVAQKEVTASASGASCLDTIGSFHEGDFFYSVDDEAEDEDINIFARNAEREYAIEKGLGTIPEVDDEDDHTLKLVPATSSNLGRFHSTMDVQPCHSSSCKQCRPSIASVVFIPRDWQPDMTPNGEDEDSSQSSENAVV